MTADRRNAAALVAAALVAIWLPALTAQNARDEARKALIARAKSLELPTKYEAPPGEKIEHYASGYAKIMCTAVFVTGLDPAFAAATRRAVGMLVDAVQPVTK